MRSELEQVLRGIARPAIAVSGGVDSLTLAAVAAELALDVVMMHAVSPAVPQEGTDRVRRLAAERGWQLTLIDAGEFKDPHYRANPVNRCFYCKTNLYRTIRSRTERSILSGANTDDLGEYRPGLDAAKDHGVRHPFIEAGIGKRAVRSISHELGLHDVAELPASPCLSSRVETGIRIEPTVLRFIHDVENLIAAEINPATVRCRVRANAIAIELDSASITRLTQATTRRLSSLIEGRPDRPSGLPVRFEPYRNGSAFLVARS